MPRAISIAAFLALCLAPRAQAACTFEQIKELLDRNIAHEQVMQLCNVVQPPGEAAARAPNSDEAGRIIAGTWPLGFAVAPLGDDGTWFKYALHGNLVLENKRDPDGYFLLVAPKPLDQGWRSLSIEVRFHHVRDGGTVGPALVFSTDPKKEELIVLHFTQDGTFNAFNWKGDELKLLSTKENRDLAMKEFHFQTYSLIQREDKIELSVDGHPTGLTVPYQGTAPTFFGIAAFGSGLYEFRNYVAKAQ